MDFGIVHPIPLAVHHVVADLHVLDDLGQAKRRGTGPPRRALGAGRQNGPAGHLEAALSGDGAADVAGIAFAERVFDVLADRIELDGQAFDVRAREVGERGNVRYSHRILLPSWSLPTLP